MCISYLCRLVVIIVYFSKYIACRSYIYLFLCPASCSYLNLITLFFPMALPPNVDHGILILEVSRSQTMTHYIRYDSSRRVINSSQRPLHDNTQYLQKNTQAPGGIRNRNLSRQAATDLRLRSRGHWERPFCVSLLYLRHFNIDVEPVPQLT